MNFGQEEANMLWKLNYYIIRIRHTYCYLGPFVVGYSIMENVPIRFQSVTFTGYLSCSGVDQKHLISQGVLFIYFFAHPYLCGDEHHLP